MAPKWTATRDQNLLLLIIKDVKVDYPKLAADWTKMFPDEDFHPTPKAVSEHVASLKRKVGDAGASVAVRNTPASKAKSHVPKGNPKTPSSKRKRAAAESMSNEDDSEEEKAMDFDTPVRKRATPSRNSVVRKYKEEDSDSEGDAMLVTSSRTAALQVNSVQDTEATDALGGSGANPSDIDAPRQSIARSRKNPQKIGSLNDSDAASDVSEFEPFQ